MSQLKNKQFLYPLSGSFTGSFSGSFTGQVTSASFATTSSYALTASVAQQVSYSISNQNLQHNVLFVDTTGPAFIQVDGGLRYNPNQDLLTTTSSFANIATSASYATSASFATNALTASYVANASSFPYTGSALITGSLGVTGSLSISGSLNVNNALYVSESNVGIGTSAPFTGASVSSSTELGVFGTANGNLIVRGYSALGGTSLTAYGAVGSNYYLDSSNGLRRKNADSVSVMAMAIGGFQWNTAASSTANSLISLSELMRLNTNGNLLLNTTTDAGYKLDVNGTARVQGNTQVTGSLNISGSITTTGTITAQTLVVQTITSSVIFSSGSNRFGNDISNTQVFTGSVSMTGSLNLSGSASVTGQINIGTNPTNAYLNGSSGNNRLTIGGYTQMVNPLYARNELGFATNADFTPDAGFSRLGASKVSVTNGTNGDFSGTLVANKILLNTTTDTGYNLYISGSSTSGSLNVNNQLYVSGSTVGVNTTGSSAYNLDVNGSARVNGFIYLQNNGQIYGSTGYVTIPSVGLYVQGGRLQMVSDIAILNKASNNFVTFAQRSTAGSEAVYVLANVGNISMSGSITITSSSLDFQQNTNVSPGSYQVIYTAATSSYKAAFFDYVIFSGSISRAGTVYSTWSGSYAEYTETYTNDVGGSTSGVILQAAISASSIQLQATASSAAWTIRSLARLL